MKATIILLLLILSTLLVGCTTTPSDSGEEAAQQEVTQAEALEEVDQSLLAEDSEIEIGEMI